MATAPALSQDWQATTFTGWIPPDDQIAAGPDYLVTATNGAVEYYTKGGTRVYSNTLASFFYLPNDFVFDPHALYDQYAGRFVLSAASTNGSTTSELRLAVSLTSNPSDGFCVYSINDDFSGTSWGDYPTLGLDDKGYYIATNQFPFSSGSVTSALFAISKAETLTCSSTTYWWWNGLTNPVGGTAFSIQPAHTYGGSSGAEYLINSDSSGTGSGLSVWRLTGALNTTTQPTLSSAGLSLGFTYAAPPDALALGSSVPIDTGDARLLNAVWRNGQIWTTQTRAFDWAGDTDTRSVLEYYTVQTSSFPSLSLAQSLAFGALGSYYYYPAIAINSNGNVTIAFNRSDASSYVEARWTGRLATDAPSTLQGSSQLKAGEAAYQNVDGSGRNRWGDYNGVAVDPSDDTAIWILAEYAWTGNRWATWAGLTYGAGPSNDDVSSPFIIDTNPYSASQLTTLATVAASDPVHSCTGMVDSNSVWYSFSAPADGALTIDTLTSNYDTVLSVYPSDSVTRADELACNDDFSGLQSEINLPVTGGSSYLIEVSDYGLPGGGTLQFHANFAASPPTLTSLLAPSTIPSSATGFTLTVIGSAFNLTSVVRWNGSDLATTYLSGTSLSAFVPEANVSSPGSAQITVYTPPPGGGTSNPLTYNFSPSP